MKYRWEVKFRIKNIDKKLSTILIAESLDECYAQLKNKYLGSDIISSRYQILGELDEKCIKCNRESCLNNDKFRLRKVNLCKGE